MKGGGKKRPRGRGKEEEAKSKNRKKKRMREVGGVLKRSEKMNLEWVNTPFDLISKKVGHSCPLPMNAVELSSIIKQFV